MANALDKRGVFWWFDETTTQTASIETSVPGSVSISEEGQIKLDLEGPLWCENTTELRWDEPLLLPHEKRIAGRLGEYGEGGYVLLDGLERTDFSLPDDNLARMSYEAVRCFSSNVLFPKNFDLDRFHELRIELSGLDQWLGLDSIRIGYEHRDGENVEVKVSYKNHKIKYETLAANIYVENLILGASTFLLSPDRPVGEVNIHQTNWLVYSPKAKSNLSDLQTVYRRIEEVIALLLGTYFRLNWPTLVGSDEEADTWYTLYFYRGPAQHQLPSNYFLWTTFSSIRDSFGEMLYQWQTKVERYGAGYELYMASLQTPLFHPEHRFVNLVWAIESLHRNWQREAGEPVRTSERKQRIQEILERFNELSDRKTKKWLIGKLKYAHEPTLEERIVEAFGRLPIGLERSQLISFAGRCAKMRNDISHEGGRRSGEDRSDFHAELQELTDALGYLFHALLLLETGIGIGQLVSAMTKGGLAEMRIIPALRRVGIDVPIPAI